MVRRTTTPRGGFTLPELLVVMAIIAVLAGLLLVGVQRARDAGKRATAVAEISQMAAAAQRFKQEFGFYPPQRFNAHSPTPEDIAVLQRMFPRANVSGLTFTAGWPAGDLNNNQALVLFLGGPGLTGWDPTNLANTNVTSPGKKGPYYDFQENRLADRSLLDPWGTPYVYFRSVNGNDYSGSMAGVSPYRSGGRFVNQNSIQVISAGKNKAFGPGGDWSAGGAGYGQYDAGGDDLGNFNGGQQLANPEQQN